jgi:hypothetical protein
MTSQEQGRYFEELFSKQCFWHGYFPIRNHLSCRFVYRGRVQIIKSQLDFTVLVPKSTEKVGFFDCKSFGAARFNWSEIPVEQINRACDINDRGYPAGFVVLFRTVNRVVYFSGTDLRKTGPGNSFGFDMGLPLGKFEDFSLSAIFSDTIDQKPWTRSSSSPFRESQKS